MAARVAFGLARLHRLPLASSRRELLETALEAGFSAFDVAPSYGNGLGEYDLGRVLAGRRGSVRIATKFGIPTSLYGPRMRHVFPFARALEKVLTRARGAAAPRRDYRADVLRSTLSGSLARLQTDYVDRLLMHEPVEDIPAEILARLAEEIGALKREGVIREFGVAGPLGSVERVLGRIDCDVIQLPLADALSKRWPGQRVVVYGTYRYFLANREAWGGDLAAMVGELGSRNPGLEFIVSSLSRRVVAGFKDLF